MIQTNENEIKFVIKFEVVYQYGIKAYDDKLEFLSALLSQVWCLSK